MVHIISVQISKPKANYVLPTTSKDLFYLSENFQVDEEYGQDEIAENNALMDTEESLPQFNVENGEKLAEISNVQSPETEQMDAVEEDENDPIELTDQVAIDSCDLDMNKGDDSDDEPDKFEMDLNMLEKYNLIEIAPGTYQVEEEMGRAANDSEAVIPTESGNEFEEFSFVVDVQDIVDYEEEIDDVLPIQKGPEPDDESDDGGAEVVDLNAKRKRSKRKKKKVCEEVEEDEEENYNY